MWILDTFDCQNEGIPKRRGGEKINSIILKKIKLNFRKVLNEI